MALRVIGRTQNLKQGPPPGFFSEGETERRERDVYLPGEMEINRTLMLLTDKEINDIFFQFRELSVCHFFCFEKHIAAVSLSHPLTAQNRNCN